MNLRHRAAVLFFALGLGLGSALGVSRPAKADTNRPRPIRVGLGTALTAVRLSADGAYTLVNMATGGVVLSGDASRVVEIQPNAAGLGVIGVGTFTGPLRLKPAAAADGQAGIARWGANRYRGDLEVLRDAAGQITLVNELNLEDYLLGVVPQEMPAAFPPEALKAQAVAARTYAIYQMQNSKYGPQGFDVVASTDSQVYGGAAGEDPRTTAAVQATRDVVVTYNGQLINALFFASGGGYTENNESVYSSVAIPYLRGVPDFDQDSPHYNWSVYFPLTDLQATLTAKGMDMGTLYSIQPAGPKGVSGRWTTLALVGSKGRLEVKASQVRFALGLKSTFFDIIPHDESYQPVQVPVSGDQPVQVLGKGGQVVTLPAGQAVVRGAGGAVTALQGSSTAAIGRQLMPASLELAGHGWGHGVGLSQWGARGMANAGNTFADILRHYYQGTTVGPRPDLAQAK